MNSAVAPPIQIEKPHGSIELRSGRLGPASEVALLRDAHAKDPLLHFAPITSDTVPKRYQVINHVPGQAGSASGEEHGAASEKRLHDALDL